MILGLIPYLYMMPAGIVSLTPQQWQDSPSILKLKENFEEAWKSDGSKHYISAIGCLHAIEDKLYPEFIGMQRDGEVEINRIEFKPILVSDLPLSEDEIREISENGYLIISKFERKESVNE